MEMWRSSMATVSRLVEASADCMADRVALQLQMAYVIKPSCLINKRLFVLDIDPLEMEVFYIAD
jgi:hypothetical protein